MKRKIITTADGSKTIYLVDWSEHYHSKHGAVQETQHVFIKNGLRHIIQLQDLNTINILEIGFGAGLNALLTAKEADEIKKTIHYVGIELFPIHFNEAKKLSYNRLYSKNKEFYYKIHQSKWEVKLNLTSYFCLTKRKQCVSNIKDENAYHIIYFDAFGWRVQPELWTISIFKIMYLALKQNGILVTYSAKGSVRRILQNIGFNVERLPGPPGKRHMLRATKYAQCNA